MMVDQIVKQVGLLATQAMAGFDLSVEIRDEPGATVIELITKVIRASKAQGYHLRGVRIGPFERQIAGVESAPDFSRLTANTLKYAEVLIVDSEDRDGFVEFSFGYSHN